jgi:hypothetical protein
MTDYKRGISSLNPMELTEEEAKTIDDSLANGTAKPKIDIKSLPVDGITEELMKTQLVQ